MKEMRYIRAGSFFDGTGAAVRRNVLLTVKNGTLAAIDSAHIPTDPSEKADNLSRCTILPALIDCSVALLHSPSIASREDSAGPGSPEQKEMLARHIRYCLAHGVLGLADNDADSAFLLHRLAGTGPGDLLCIRTPAVFRPASHSGVAEPGSGDFLRIHNSESIDVSRKPAPRLSPRELRRILKRRDHRKVIVVANGIQPVADALAAGCDAIEQGYGMGVDNLMKMAQHNVLWIPSILRAKNALDGSASGGSVCCRFSLRYVAPGKPEPGAEAFWKKMLAGQLKQLQLARELGVPTAIGTGAGTAGILHGESMAEEMKLFLKAGYTLAETIRCASSTPAEFFNMTRLGPLTVGKHATFIVTRGTPQQLPRKLAYLEDIYIDGSPSPAYRKNPG